MQRLKFDADGILLCLGENLENGKHVWVYHIEYDLYVSYQFPILVDM